MGDRTRGLYKKFNVERTDGTSALGRKHEGCEYFVLDITHDPHSGPALLGYAEPARKDGYELLANDILSEYEFRIPDTQRDVTKDVSVRAFQNADEHALHIAICRAVALLNRTVNDDEQRQAHNILRGALDNYGR